MIFSSISFLFYLLPLFLLVYYLLPNKVLYKNIWFLFISLFFYFWGENLFILVLLFSILFNYSIGLLLSKEKFNQKLLLIIGVFANLSLLIWFKYTPFLAKNIAVLFGNPDTSSGLWKTFLNIHLPLGISFFTFQGMSYVFDVYRKDAKAEKSLPNLALYISMFPQLIAGPIVRFKDIAIAIRERHITLDNIIHGINLFIIGLGYKVLLANNVALPADKIFALGEASLTFGLAWLGVICYTLQIYFDFCGYSTMAVGLGLMLGIKFPKNFNFPYISQSITEFWRRWHITLSQWFRDYLYIPLGGNRKGNFNTYRNLLLVFVLCGIWHGASWAFLVWGLYHGLFLVIERLGLGDLLKKITPIFRYTYTLLIVMIGWVFFRAETFDKAFYFLKTMFGLGQGTEYDLLMGEVLQNNVIIAIFVGMFLSTPFINQLFFGKNREWSSLMDLSVFPKTNYTGVWYFGLIIIFILSAFNLVNLTYNPFIYFRF